MQDPAARHIVVGRISGLHGIRGWIKVFSYTEPRANVIAYRPWRLERERDWREVEIEEGRPQGQTLIAKLAGIDDRDSAAEWVGADIVVRRDQLPACDEQGEHYWADLEGLSVVNGEGVCLGVVNGFLETGAHDVMVLSGERERLVPFVTGKVVQSVDLDAGTITVDWDAEF